MDIGENVKRVRAAIPGRIAILAASKSRTPEEMEQVRKAGISLFGENYVQEAASKIPLFRDEAEFHLIGHLQVNKVRKAVRLFSCIQSVDSFRLAEAISRACEEMGRRMPVLIEVNSGEEEGKTGCRMQDAPRLAEQMEKLPGIRLRGVMTLGPAKEPREAFRAAKRLFDSLRIRHPGMDTLSMGMSDSFEEAILQGATMVRLGTALFGPRMR